MLETNPPHEAKACKISAQPSPSSQLDLGTKFVNGCMTISKHTQNWIIHPRTQPGSENRVHDQKLMKSLHRIVFMGEYDDQPVDLGICGLVLKIKGNTSTSHMYLIILQIKTVNVYDVYTCIYVCMCLCM